MSSVEFFVPGKPQTKGSTKSFRNPKTARIVTLNDNPKTKGWQRTIGWLALQAGVTVVKSPVGVIVEMEFVLARPKSHYGTGRNAERVKASAPAHHVTKPDVDKLVRAVLDGLTGFAYADDSQVTGAPSQKRYAEPGESTGVRIRLHTVSGSRGDA